LDSELLSLSQQKGSRALLPGSLISFRITSSYGCGGGVVVLSCRFNFGGSCFSAGFCSLPSGFVVGSSGVGWRRFSVGRPGAPSSALGSAPVLEALAFESRNNFAFTR
jgi:hypothetical protein